MMYVFSGNNYVCRDVFVTNFNDKWKPAKFPSNLIESVAFNGIYYDEDVGTNMFNRRVTKCGNN